MYVSRLVSSCSSVGRFGTLSVSSSSVSATKRRKKGCQCLIEGRARLDDGPGPAWKRGAPTMIRREGGRRTRPKLSGRLDVVLDITPGRGGHLC